VLQVCSGWQSRSTATVQRGCRRGTALPQS
jgi:hypothetical protein